MPSGRLIPPLTLNPDEQQTLKRWSRRRHSSAQAVALCWRVRRARATPPWPAIFISRNTPWPSGAAGFSLVGSLDEPHSGAPRQISDAAVECVLTLTLETHPHDAGTRGRLPPPSGNHQRPSPALRLDQNRGRNPRQSSPLL
jgi:hypothetical protein